MQNYMLIFFGGAIGSCLRFFLSQSLSSIQLFPHNTLGTFIANLTGSLLLGALVAANNLARLNDPWFFLLAVGLCGGLTTFSTFIYDIIKIHETGSVYTALAYPILSVIIALALCLFSYHQTARFLVK